MCYPHVSLDVNRVRVEDVSFKRDRVTVYMRKNKTDELNEGGSFSVDARGRGFSIQRFLEDYISRMDLKKIDALFPLNVAMGARVAAVSYSVMYHALEGAKERMGL